LQEAYNNNPDTRTKLRTALLLKTCYQKSDDVEGFQNVNSYIFFATRIKQRPDFALKKTFSAEISAKNKNEIWTRNGNWSAGMFLQP
jgi:hypothetical protein